MQRRIASIAAVYGGALVQGLVIVSFPASGAVLKAAHGFSDAQYGAIFLPQTALAIVGSLLAGGLARRLGLPALGRLALAAALAGELLLAATSVLAPGPAYAILLLAGGLAGLGYGLAAAPLNTAPGVLFPARRETALVVVHALIGAGFATGPLLAGLAVDQGPWAGFPLGLAALAAVLLIPATPAAPPSPASHAAASPTGASIFWSLTAIAVLYALCEGTFASWIVLFLQEERGVAAPKAALALSSFWGALVAGRLLVSALVLRVPSQRLWSALPVLMFAAFWLLSGVHGALSGIVLFALAGFACSAFFPLTVDFACARFNEHVAWVSSMLTASLILGVGLGSFALGALRRVTSRADLYRWSPGYDVLLLALVLVLALRKGETT